MTINKSLYRDPERGRIAGVCAGIAEYFGLEIWLVRILVVTGFVLLAGPFMLVAYVAAWFILDKKPGTGKGKGKTPAHQTVFAHHGGKGWHNVDDEERKVEVKSRVWQAGEPPRQAFFDIKHQFEKIETRLRKMEGYVTSSEYQLNREINKL
ncbi:envelope stress response membrane protein PspC [Aestuariibacter halophilus]|uniref:Envelope stress response membrane protein PspC n=1 Tax=Fluctibacter halophilus TaxID=226011 RepID=A0ABS8G817_9ALTE|nr:envelope stress response membrane protein PspC [Aestuariibacter halophilus]MCC2616663.1 envelope stress response membrane protein PspC [Aestuariibacter halophilus]